MEIYCERIRDLLEGPASSSGAWGAGGGVENLQVKQDAVRGVYIEGETAGADGRVYGIKAVGQMSASHRKCLTFVTRSRAGSRSRNWCSSGKLHGAAQLIPRKMCIGIGLLATDLCTYKNTTRHTISFTCCYCA